MFLVSQAGISLLGEVNRFGDTVDNQRSRGAKIAGFGSLDLKSDRCVVLQQNDSYHHLMEDRDPSFPSEVTPTAVAETQV